MNLDLITKLAKLANNNPNDNEANAAARRVCKLLEDGKFQFGVNNSKPDTKPSQPTYQHVPNNPADWFRRYYTEQRQQQSQQNTGQHRCKNCGAHLDYIVAALGNTYCNNCKQQKARKEDDQYDWSKVKIDFDFETNSKPKSKPIENVTVKCLFCKQDFKRKTFDINFVCHQCYIKKNKSEKPPIKDDITKTYYKAVFCFSCGHNFTVTYTDLTNESIGQVVGKCPQCKASYIRATK